jgi:hypothetical protein
MGFIQFFMFEISFQLWAMGSESFIHPHHQSAILKYEQYFCNVPNLTLLARCKILFFKVKVLDSYIKRSMKHLVMMEVSNMS